MFNKTTLAQKEAALYEKLADNRVQCHLCAHHCKIPEGQFGVCHVRQNINGTLYSLVYGRTIAQHVDPIEKKPLYHFYPGSNAYSIATPGCCFRCEWCQNWEISQMPREQHLVMGENLSPEQIITQAQQSNSRSIAYTYTEPTIFFEYAYDTAILAHEAGLRNLYITGGYMTEAMLEQFSPYLDAANVDLKGFRDETYRKHAGAHLQPVLDTLKTMRRLGLWIEVTTLIIPDLNDDESELRDIAQFIAQELGTDTPWHISRFFPNYKMRNRWPTPTSTMQMADDIGREAGLRYVYMGNVPVELRGHTHCPQCETVLIRRLGYRIDDNRLINSRCPECKTEIAGIWD